MLHTCTCLQPTKGPCEKTCRSICPCHSRQWELQNHWSRCLPKCIVLSCTYVEHGTVFRRFLTELGHWLQAVERQYESLDWLWGLLCLERQFPKGHELWGKFCGATSSVREHLPCPSSASVPGMLLETTEAVGMECLNNTTLLGFCTKTQPHCLRHSVQKTCFVVVMLLVHSSTNNKQKHKWVWFIFLCHIARQLLGLQLAAVISPSFSQKPRSAPNWEEAEDFGEGPFSFLAWEDGCRLRVSKEGLGWGGDSVILNS